MLVDHGVNPSWSADGKEVFFLGERFTDYDARLYSVPLNGDRPTGTPSRFHPDWSVVLDCTSARWSYLVHRSP